MLQLTKQIFSHETPLDPAGSGGWESLLLSLYGYDMNEDDEEDRLLGEVRALYMPPHALQNIQTRGSVGATPSAEMTTIWSVLQDHPTHNLNSLRKQQQGLLYLSRIVVTPAYRQRGVGTQLLSLALRTFEHHFAPVMHIIQAVPMDILLGASHEDQPDEVYEYDLDGGDSEEIAMFDLSSYRALGALNPESASQYARKQMLLRQWYKNQGFTEFSASKPDVMFFLSRPAGGSPVENESTAASESLL